MKRDGSFLPSRGLHRDLDTTTLNSRVIGRSDRTHRDFGPLVSACNTSMGQLKESVMNQALIVVDAQNEFSSTGLRPVPNHATALAAILEHVASARAERRPIAWVQHHNRPTESRAFVPESWGAAFSPGLGPQAGYGPEAIFQKDVYGAFTGTGLEDVAARTSGSVGPHRGVLRTHVPFDVRPRSPRSRVRCVRGPERDRRPGPRGRHARSPNSRRSPAFGAAAFEKHGCLGCGPRQPRQWICRRPVRMTTLA